MENEETNLKTDVNKEKREIIILVLIFSAVSTFFTLLFDKTGFEQVIGLASAICFGFFILWWCKVDSVERNYELKTSFRFLVVLFGAFALLVYLFKTRGFKDGMIATSYALLIFMGIVVLTGVVTALFSFVFNVEM